MDNTNLALALEELVRSNSESNETMQRLVENVRRETEARDRKIEVLAENHRQMRRLVGLVCGAVVLLLGIAFVNAFNIASQRRNAAQTAEIARDVRATNNLLLDCLNATGECGRANAESQKRILDEVKKYELTGFYCIRTNPATDDPEGAAFLSCMERLYPGGPKLNTP